MDKTTEKTPQVAPQPQARPCPQDCGKCGPWQQMFCCTKMTFELSKNVQSMGLAITQMQEEIAELKKGMPSQTLELSNPLINDNAQ